MKFYFLKTNLPKIDKKGSKLISAESGTAMIAS
jgi:hypothetical protein